MSVLNPRASCRMATFISDKRVMGGKNEERAVNPFNTSKMGEQIIGILREQEAAAKTADVCRKQ